ncbi:MAG: multiheme c-type cytochrome [Planctomycetota bacterium]
MRFTASRPAPSHALARARLVGVCLLVAGVVAALGLARAEPGPLEPALSLVLVGEEAGFLVPAHGGEGLAGRAARARQRTAAGTPTRLLAVGGSLGPGTATSRRLSADHLRAVLATGGAIGHLLAADDLDEPALAQGWRGEGPLGEPTPPLNVLLAPDHPAAGRPPWLDVDVAGVPLRVFSLVGERAGTALRDAGSARAWIAASTALQNLRPDTGRCWVAVLDADVDVAAVAAGLGRLATSVTLVVRGTSRLEAPRREGDALVVELARGARAGLVLTFTVDAEGAWKADADVVPAVDPTAPSGAPETELLGLFHERLEGAAAWREVAALDRARPRHVGPQVCASCHGALAADPAVLGHLEGSAGGALAAEPGCAACHATGYVPGERRLARHTDGFRSEAATPWLAGVSCEACHGPGGDHVMDPQRQGALREDPAAACAGCHDPLGAPGLEARAPGARGFHAAVEPAARTRVPPEWLARLEAAGLGKR